MDEVASVVGWFVLASAAFTVIGASAIVLARQIIPAKPPQIAGAELPVLSTSFDLAKRYDIVYEDNRNAAPERLLGVRILGYLRSDRDQTTGEYMDSRWLVVELPDGRRAYLRPRSVLWMLESESQTGRGGP